MLALWIGLSSFSLRMTDPATSIHEPACVLSSEVGMADMPQKECDWTMDVTVTPCASSFTVQLFWPNTTQPWTGADMPYRIYQNGFIIASGNVGHNGSTASVPASCTNYTFEIWNVCWSGIQIPVTSDGCNGNWLC